MDTCVCHLVIIFIDLLLLAILFFFLSLYFSCFCLFVLHTATSGTIFEFMLYETKTTTTAAVTSS
jgi:hypothetical protein